MKNHNSEEEAKLTELLSSWKVDEPLPPRFDQQVWQRIARAETSSINVWQSVYERILEAFSRPRLALSYVTILLLLGLLGGYMQAQYGNQQRIETLKSSYVQMLDPYQMTSR